MTIHPRWSSTVLFTAVLGATCAPLVSAKAPPREAAQLVEEALQHETLGLNAERAQLLQEAERLAPAAAPVRWAQGQVLYQKEWVAADALPSLAKKQPELARYQEERGNHPDTAAGQFQLAQWCEKQHLSLQARAHLTRVIELEPNHLAARQALGFVASGEQWISPEEIVRSAKHAQLTASNFERWQPKIIEIGRDLTSPISNKRQAGAKRLAAIDDPAAIVAIEQLLCQEQVELAELAVAAIAKLEATEATRCLARQAVYSPWIEVRRQAGKALRGRPYDQFVPMMLGSLYMPIELRVRYARGAGDQLIQQQVFAREGQTQRELLALNTALTRSAVPGGDRNESAQRAQRTLTNENIAAQQQMWQQNISTLALNRRITDALTLATTEKLGEKPDAWWDWWNSYNDVFVEGSKQIVAKVVTREITIADQPPPPPPVSRSPSDPTVGRSSSPTPLAAAPQPRTVAQQNAINIGRPISSYDCLVAGTPVWTLTGPLPIEQIRLGDLVLSQDPDSGELTYKPVLKTTIRPAGQLLRIEAGHREQLETSGGHLFWVAGQGWVKARELKSGMLLHTPTRSLAVSNVQDGSTAQTYNLVVADFHTYFVGQERVLSHDNTIRQPTDAVVPGSTAHQRSTTTR